MARKTNWKVWFGRVRAIAWLIGGLVALLAGATDSVALVWWASVYANAESGFATAEASNNKEVMEKLDRIERNQREGVHCNGCSCAESA
jgi:hypothetical protein